MCSCVMLQKCRSVPRAVKTPIRLVPLSSNQWILLSTSEHRIPFPFSGVFEVFFWEEECLPRVIHPVRLPPPPCSTVLMNRAFVQASVTRTSPLEIKQVQLPSLWVVDYFSETVGGSVQNFVTLQMDCRLGVCGFDASAMWKSMGLVGREPWVWRRPGPPSLSSILRLAVRPTPPNLFHPVLGEKQQHFPHGPVRKMVLARCFPSLPLRKGRCFARC